MNIPKKLHLYWGRNKPLTWLRYMTAKSFSMMNPDWSIYIWHPEKPGLECNWDTGQHSDNNWGGEDWFDKLSEIDNVKVKKADLDGIPLINDVQRSDIFRWRILHRDGGFWSDFDILYFDSMSKLGIPKDTDICLCNGEVPAIKGWLAIGFLGGGKGNFFFRDMEQLALQLAAVKHLKYQDLGSDLLGKFFEPGQIDYLCCKIHEIKQFAVYPFRDVRTQQISMWRDRTALQLDNTIGIHWFAGQGKSAKNENLLLNDRYLDKLIKKSGMHYAFEELSMVDKFSPVIVNDGGVKYSFIMPYFDRPMVLHNSLVSLHHHYGDRKDWEIVVVQDEKNKLVTKFLDVIKHWESRGIKFVITKEITGASSYNPAKHYNIAAKNANGLFFIITSPEIFHVSNVLAGLDDEFDNDSECYVVCSCLDVRREKNNRIKNINDFKPVKKKWFQHSSERNKCYHFCTAISKKKYFEIGGFDEEFANGFCFDDDDFIQNIKTNIKKIITRDDLLTYHQEHYKLGSVIPNRMVLWNKNKSLFEKKWGIKYINENI